jgi:hypothetical protein
MNQTTTEATLKEEATRKANRAAEEQKQESSELEAYLRALQALLEIKKCPKPENNFDWSGNLQGSLLRNAEDARDILAAARGTLAAARGTLAAARGTLAAARETLTSAQQAQTTAQQFVSHFQRQIIELDKARRDLAEAKEDLAEAKKDLAKAEAGRAEAKEDLAEAKKDLAKAEEVLAEATKSYLEQFWEAQGTGKSYPEDVEEVIRTETQRARDGEDQVTEKAKCTFESLIKVPSSFAADTSKWEKANPYLTVNRFPEVLLFCPGLRSLDQTAIAQTHPDLEKLSSRCHTLRDCMLPHQYGNEADMNRTIGVTLEKVFSSPFCVQSEKASQPSGQDRMDHAIYLKDSANKSRPICIIETKQWFKCSSDPQYQAAAYYANLTQSCRNAEGTLQPMLILIPMAGFLFVYGAVTVSCVAHVAFLSMVPLFFEQQAVNALAHIVSFLDGTTIGNDTQLIYPPGPIDSIPPITAGLTRMDETKSVFSYKTDTRDVFLKSSSSYGLEVHKAMAEKKYAPEYLGHRIGNGQYLVAMEDLQSTGFVTFDSYLSRNPPSTQLDAVKDAVTAAVDYLHAQGFVHGDLRPPNIMVSVTSDRPEVRIIDFDWAGRPGCVYYPMNLSLNIKWGPNPHTYCGQPITVANDKFMMAEMFPSTSSGSSQPEGCPAERKEKRPTGTRKRPAGTREQSPSQKKPKLH